MQKDEIFLRLCEQYEPLINRTLSQNFIWGLTKEDLLQELLLVAWEVFAKRDIQFPTTYLSTAFHNRVTNLYTEAQRFYYPSVRFRCVACSGVSAYYRVQCECGGKRWKQVKGPLVAAVPEDVPYEHEAEVFIEEFPEELRKTVTCLLSGKKTGYKQKAKLRDYIQWVELTKG